MLIQQGSYRIEATMKYKTDNGWFGKSYRKQVIVSLVCKVITIQKFAQMNTGNTYLQVDGRTLEYKNTFRLIFYLKVL